MENVYLNRQNTIDLAIVVDRVPQNAPNPLNGVNRVRLRLVNDVDNAVSVYDSQDFPAFFDTSTVRNVGGYQVKILRIALGQSALPVGTYECQIIVFDATYTLGLVVGKIRLTVEQA